jgi:16S rRNA (guanine1516-N2)-methyltransferase
MSLSDLLLICTSAELQTRALALAQLLQIPLADALPALITDREQVLVLDEQGLALQQTGRKAPGPVRADFVQGAVDHRRKQGGGKGQMIAKAVGLKAGVYPQVLDLTAGLGRDAFVLASLGCSVQLVERSPVVHALLEDGLMRARLFAEEQDQELLQILLRMQLIRADGREYLQALTSTPDVIYLDPMFPERDKSADVKKEMRAFHSLVGRDEDSGELLTLALQKAGYRVVVKRPRRAPFLADQPPGYQLEGKSSRYDIYALKKLPERLPSV